MYVLQRHRFSGVSEKRENGERVREKTTEALLLGPVAEGSKPNPPPPAPNTHQRLRQNSNKIVPTHNNKTTTATNNKSPLPTLSTERVAFKEERVRSRSSPHPVRAFPYTDDGGGDVARCLTYNNNKRRTRRILRRFAAKERNSATSRAHYAEIDRGYVALWFGDLWSPWGSPQRRSGGHRTKHRKPTV